MVGVTNVSLRRADIFVITALKLRFMYLQNQEKEPNTCHVNPLKQLFSVAELRFYGFLWMSVLYFVYFLNKEIR